MSLRAFVLIDPPLESYYVDNSLIEYIIDSYYSSLRSFSIKSPSSNCAKVVVSPVCSCDDVAYGIYETDDRIAIASE